MVDFSHFWSVLWQDRDADDGFKNTVMLHLSDQMLSECVNYILESTLPPSQKLTGFAFSPTSPPPAKFQGNPCAFIFCVLNTAFYNSADRLMSPSASAAKLQPRRSLFHKGGENGTLSADFVGDSPPNGQETHPGCPAHDMGVIWVHAALFCT